MRTEDGRECAQLYERGQGKFRRETMNRVARRQADSREAAQDSGSGGRLC